MRPLVKAFLIVVGVLAVLGGAGLLFFMRSGMSARPEPGKIETFMALTIRDMAIAHRVRNVKNPVERSPEVIAAGREHFADHCSPCHANDGSGNTEMGRGLYPRVPDMRLSRTQKLTDGQLFHIIEHGVRLTGMPAWGTGTPEGETASWHLVHFIRHLPELSDAEVAEMEKLNPISPAEAFERIEEERFLAGDQPITPPDSSHEHQGGHP